MTDATGWHLNFDSAPFCNGSLHLGHVRNYALGDVRARWLRSIGTDVTYATAYDSFGLPNELGAREAGRATDRYVAAQVRRIGRQLARLHLSYDDKPRDYSSPRQYRWSQWLFLRLWDAGLVYRAERNVAWCQGCAEVISVIQAERYRCWRCGGLATMRLSPEWYVRSSSFGKRLRSGLDGLSGWSDRARKLAGESIVRAETLDRDLRGSGDWLLSRVRGWGTPLPMVDCPDCGVSPVPDSDLPVRLAEHGGSGVATCRGCGGSRPLVGRTLDCFFDDAWCFEGATRGVGRRGNPFEAWRTRPPARVHFHAGHDAFSYLFFFRLMGHLLHDLGLSDRTEPIDWFHGHDVVTADGVKMAKRHGNAPNLDKLLSREGPAVLRLAMLAGANPDRPMAWSDDALVRGRRFARMLARLRTAAGVGSGDDGLGDDARETGAGIGPATREPDLAEHRTHSAVSEKELTTLERQLLARIDGFVSEYRVASALDVLFTATNQALKRPGTRCELLGALLTRWEWCVPRTIPVGRRRTDSGRTDRTDDASAE